MEARIKVYGKQSLKKIWARLHVELLHGAIARRLKKKSLKHAKKNAFAWIDYWYPIPYAVVCCAPIYLTRP